MARKTLKDESGKTYEVEIPDDDPDESDDDDDAIYLDEEDIQWLKDARRKASEADRKAASESGTPKKSGGKVIRIRAKQASADSGSTSKTDKTRKRVLRLA